MNSLVGAGLIKHTVSAPLPLPAIAIRRNGELILFDCGEGLQRQMIKAKIGFHRKTKVFITHMHGDHVLGLPGLLQTMSLMNRDKKIKIFHSKISIIIIAN